MNTIQKHLSTATCKKERQKILYEIRKYIADNSKQFQPWSFVEIQKTEVYDNSHTNSKIIKILRDKNFLVQIFDQDGTIRITVNRVHINDNGDWLQGISWDELMTIKRLVGYGDFDAVEIYPKDKDIVNVANMRHLFILNNSLGFIWRKNEL